MVTEGLPRLAIEPKICNKALSLSEEIIRGSPSPTPTSTSAHSLHHSHLRTIFPSPFSNPCSSCSRLCLPLALRVQAPEAKACIKHASSIAQCHLNIPTSIYEVDHQYGTMTEEPFNLCTSITLINSKDATPTQIPQNPHCPFTIVRCVTH